ncbi:Excalibur calcium-binding domain protein [Variovorax sp. SRS16]|uniref:excalibur calcium-binding domain-containing protein n=1 Tax=Variovorax sp. SRS16 TaxID=282217 RepID=UPI0013182B41|nr:excalibur calcium-binding domain-containing protein [Variovorax sp. SRS16]VTU12856.1 Excalibur calcium-binding domain protein [Variovorax sp. SRS16]
MKNVIVLVIICLAGWKAFTYYEQRQQVSRSVTEKVWSPDSGSQPASVNTAFRCDGRTYCSQMTSCEEATYFLKNCPGVKMDGNGDGVPCEKQWCR